MAEGTAKSSPFSSTNSGTNRFRALGNGNIQVADATEHSSSITTTNVQGDESASVDSSPSSTIKGHSTVRIRSVLSNQFSVATVNPTDAPTNSPNEDVLIAADNSTSESPTREPTPVPTLEPTTVPNKQPTPTPYSDETHEPTNSPISQTPSPTNMDTGLVQLTPSSPLFGMWFSRPTTSPTNNGGGFVAQAPTTTNAPTQSQTEVSVDIPTLRPTNNDTDTPTHGPTRRTRRPTPSPTNNDTSSPTASSSNDNNMSTIAVGIVDDDYRWNAASPTIQPTNNPTPRPLFDIPSSTPTSTPTALPTVLPSPAFTDDHPSSIPTEFPSTDDDQPTSVPTAVPMIGNQPTSRPTVKPTSIPTMHPSHDDDDHPWNMNPGGDDYEYVWIVPPNGNRWNQPTPRIVDSPTSSPQQIWNSHPNSPTTPTWNNNEAPFADGDDDAEFVWVVQPPTGNVWNEMPIGDIPTPPINVWNANPTNPPQISPTWTGTNPTPTDDDGKYVWVLQPNSGNEWTPTTKSWSQPITTDAPTTPPQSIWNIDTDSPSQWVRPRKSKRPNHEWNTNTANPSQSTEHVWVQPTSTVIPEPPTTTWVNPTPPVPPPTWIQPTSDQVWNGHPQSAPTSPTWIQPEPPSNSPQQIWNGQSNNAPTGGQWVKVKKTNQPAAQNEWNWNLNSQSPTRGNVWEHGSTPSAPTHVWKQPEHPTGPPQEVWNQPSAASEGDQWIKIRKTRRPSNDNSMWTQPTYPLQPPSWHPPTNNWNGNANPSSQPSKQVWVQPTSPSPPTDVPTPPIHPPTWTQPNPSPPNGNIWNGNPSHVASPVWTEPNHPHQGIWINPTPPTSNTWNNNPTPPQDGQWVRVRKTKPPSSTLWNTPNNPTEVPTYSSQPIWTPGNHNLPPTENGQWVRQRHVKNPTNEPTSCNAGELGCSSYIATDDHVYDDEMTLHRKP